MLMYFLVFLIAFLVTFFVTPLIIRYAIRIKALDLPGRRKIHQTPIPRLGGVAVYLGFLSATLVFMFWAKTMAIQVNYKNLVGILLGGTLLLLVGIWDDVRGITPKAKLICQTFAALLVIFFGIEVSYVTNPLNGLLAMGIMAIPFTLLWIVGITNAMNLIDGLDGLAAGVTAIASIALFFVALRTHQIGAAMILLILGGTSLGFLRYNFYPASIFLGDSGSMFLGFVLAAASIIGVLKTTLVVALVVPILILGVPIFDTLFAIGRRIGSGKHPFEADNKHIHHILLRAGFNMREAVFAIYIACFILSIIALVMALQK